MNRAAPSSAPTIISLADAISLLPAGEVPTWREGKGYTFTELVYGKIISGF